MTHGENSKLQSIWQNQVILMENFQQEIKVV